MTGRVSRACDGCRVRKVRCNGAQPCSQCAHLSLKCVFAPPPGKRKPGVRGRLVAQLRNSQAQTQAQTESRTRPNVVKDEVTQSSSPSPLSNTTVLSPASSNSNSNSNSTYQGNFIFAYDSNASVKSPRTATATAATAATAPSVTSIAAIVNPYAAYDSTVSSRNHNYNHKRNAHSHSHPHHDRSTSSGHSSRYTLDFFLNLLQPFQDMVYPVNPVISPSEIHAAIYNMHSDAQDAALVYAYAAVTINLTQMSWTSGAQDGSDIDIALEITSLMRLSLDAHSCADHARDALGVAGNSCIGELPVTLKRIMTCVFLQICMMAFKRHDRAFALLREAIMMIQVLNVHQFLDTDDQHPSSLSTSSSVPTPAPEPAPASATSPFSPVTTTTTTTTSSMPHPHDIARLRRVYWEAYIHERFLSTVTGFPCILPPLANSTPIEDPTIPPHVDVGFNCLINLFKILDGPFLAHWTAQKDCSTIATPKTTATVTAQWIESKQADLDRDEAAADEAERSLIARTQQDPRHAGDTVAGFTELQVADLLVTRLWLRTLVWQFALSHGLLRSALTSTSHEGLSLHFPAQRLSVQLRTLVSRLNTVSSIVIHGSGILQKLFEITSTVADVLALPLGVGQTQEDFRARLEDFEFLVRFIFGFERIQKEQRDYLREKLGALQRQYTIVDFTELATASPNT